MRPKMGRLLQLLQNNATRLDVPRANGVAALRVDRHRPITEREHDGQWPIANSRNPRYHPPLDMIDLGSLNPQQREAVMHGDGPLLVLAGAGSGKTRVITFRIAYLVGNKGVDASQILAVTFTNKAAAEMQERIYRLVPAGGGRPTIGTFHSTALRVLRKYADKLGYTSSFVVYDTADQMTLIRRCMRELSLDEDSYTPRSVLSRISKAKNDLLSPSEFEKYNHDFFGTKVAEVYRLYQKRLKEFDAMDFDDLIGQYVHLLRDFEEVRNAIRARWRHILIDEYQDTNHAQYSLVKLLAGEGGNVVAVGDEDQSIYKFRGANIQNILNFERDFPGARIIKLEQNYRSTGNILDAATGVVSNNVARKGKTLFTDAGKGEPVRVVSCETDREEAKFVVEKIQELRRGGMTLDEFAILFRTNAQSRSFEEELLKANIPYTVVGGVKFYERAEIKDLLAYLRLSIRPHDTPSIERVINVPARGIGGTTTKALDQASREGDVSLWTVIDGPQPYLAERARKAVREFRDLMADLQQGAANPLPQFLDFLLVRTGYRKMLLESTDPQDETRLQNIEELVNSAREFYEANPASTISDYLDSVSLMSDLDNLQSGKGVTLMTLHSAKGLEFKVVFLGGMEEGILPHSQSRDEDDDVEEERRLCYVGMTRAREQLYCLHALQRRIHGQFREQSPSPFLREIPSKVTEEVKLRVPNYSAGYARPSYGGGSSYGSGSYGSSSNTPSWREKPLAPKPRAYAVPPKSPATANAPKGVADAKNVFGFFQNSPVQFDPSAIQQPARQEGAAVEFKRGARVRHEQFGDGIILTMEGSGPDAKLSVYFDRAGTKKFIAKFAKLKKL
jgi:DNA helicase-2/ATP-dependent DNA helicase PcrA